MLKLGLFCEIGSWGVEAWGVLEIGFVFSDCWDLLYMTVSRIGFVFSDCGLYAERLTRRTAVRELNSYGSPVAMVY